MKRLQLYKSASDFAFGTLETADLATLDIAAATQFQKENLNAADYGQWKQYMQQCRNNFLMLSRQFVPSYVPPKPTPPAPAAPETA